MRRFALHFSIWAALGALLAAPLLAAETNLPPSPPASVRPKHHLSPVEFFRALLGMSATEQERVLTNRSPADKAVILAKVREYKALPRDIREARLCQTELHWELSGLMKLAPRDRTNRLAEVSPLYLPMVNELLQQWDKVPADTQKTLLEKQSFIGLYLRMQGTSTAAQREILATLPLDRRAQWAEDMGRWQALPEKQRADLCAQFQRFCGLSGSKQKETVNALSDADRREMETALHAFNRLSPAQRTECISSFGKFATMTDGERRQFLKNAAHWDAMTVSERQLWRNLVQKLPPMPPGFPSDMPPLPPGLGEGTPPMPPMPPNVITPVIVARSYHESH